MSSVDSERWKSLSAAGLRTSKDGGCFSLGRNARPSRGSLLDPGHVHQLNSRSLSDLRSFFCRTFLMHSRYIRHNSRICTSWKRESVAYTRGSFCDRAACRVVATRVSELGANGGGKGFAIWRPQTSARIPRRFGRVFPKPLHIIATVHDVVKAGRGCWQLIENWV
jgi:hypothetical protein